MNSAAAPAPARPPVLGRSLVKYVIAGALMTAILLLISGRPEWWQAWAYIALTVGAQTGIGLTLHRRCPDLLRERSRIQAGTKTFDKVLAPLIALVGPLAIWIVAALDIRAAWPPIVPAWSTAAAFAVSALGIAISAWAMLTNRFFAATVRIQSDRGQTVVSTGPYARIRHPGYTGALLFTLASPFALGSYDAMIPASLTALVLVVRTALEDRTLQAELDGYAAYAQRVRSRLLPGIW